jgi:hydroxymethylpyrimidine/phosphomethylpyrimidine kinase
MKPVVLSIAGHDPVGGAGIQADIESIQAMGCHAATVITCLTIQDTGNVYQLQAVDPDWVYQQAKTVLQDLSVSVFKLGLLGSVENSQKIGQLLAEHPDIPVIYDPVLAAGGGKELSTASLLDAIRQSILPHVTLLTPNLPEAIRLAQADELLTQKTFLPQELENIAIKLYESGCESILLTGTHHATDAVYNTLYGYAGNKVGVLNTQSWQRLPDDYHGSGCTLAASIAGRLAHEKQAQGKSMIAVVKDAQQFTWQSLYKAQHLGKGQKIPDRRHF